MKRKMTLSLVVCVGIACSLLFAGCGKDEKTITTPDGKVTVKTSPSGQQGAIQVESKDGKATIVGGPQQSVNPAEVGAPIYPGAQVQMSGKYEGKEQAGKESFAQYIFVTNDAYEKVVEFYKANLKDVKGSFTQNTGTQKMTMFQVGDKAQQHVNVIFDSNKNQTTIQIMRVSQ